MVKLTFDKDDPYANLITAELLEEIDKLKSCFDAYKAGSEKGAELLHKKIDKLKNDRLTKPAKVGNTIFQTGVLTRLVVERAQRNYVYDAERKFAEAQKHIGGMSND